MKNCDEYHDSNYQEVLEVLNDINRRLAAIGQSLAAEVEMLRGAESVPERLRTLGYELVSLAGRLTALGVDVARTAEDHGGKDGGAN